MEAICCGCRMSKPSEAFNRNAYRKKREHEWVSTEIGRASRRASESSKYAKRKTDPKVRARYTLRQAVRSGRIAKLPCEQCGAAAEAHHEDYGKPLEVRWLCRPHHAELHRAG